jgi:hypothetical protein
MKVREGVGWHMPSWVTHPIHHLPQPQLMEGRPLHVCRVVGRCSALAAKGLSRQQDNCMLVLGQGVGMHVVWQASVTLTAAAAAAGVGWASATAWSWNTSLWGWGRQLPSLHGLLDSPYMQLPGAQPFIVTAAAVPIKSRLLHAVSSI